MSYKKNKWRNGFVITAAKLNNIEEGIAALDAKLEAAFAPVITNPQDGDVLVYDASAQKWVNAAPSAASSVESTSS